MSQAIKYQNTTVEPFKSANEIAMLVQKYGGTRFEMRWDNGRLAGVRFAIKHERLGEVPVRLDAKTKKIEDILYSKTSKGREACRDLAYRIAWRQLKDFVEQSLLAVETGLFPLHEAFMAQMETPNPEGGEPITVGQLFEKRATAVPGGITLMLAAPIVEAEYEVLT